MSARKSNIPFSVRGTEGLFWFNFFGTFGSVGNSEPGRFEANLGRCATFPRALGAHRLTSYGRRSTLILHRRSNDFHRKTDKAAYGGSPGYPGHAHSPDAPLRPCSWAPNWQAHSE